MGSTFRTLRASLCKSSKSLKLITKVIRCKFISFSILINNMAFRRSAILKRVHSLQSLAETPSYLDASKLKYDPKRYGHQYSTNDIIKGYTDGRRFLNRVPNYREIHPEIIDWMKAQKAMLAYYLVGISVVMHMMFVDRYREDAEFLYHLFRDKAFVGRYDYKTKTVEYQGRMGHSYQL